MSEYDEFQLEPLVERKSPLSESAAIKSARVTDGFSRRTNRYQRNPHTSIYSLDETAPQVSARELAAERPNDSEVVVSSAPAAEGMISFQDRDYPILKSIAKLYRIFAYVAVVLAFLAIASPLLPFDAFAVGDEALTLANFCRRTFFIIVGTTLVSGTLLGCSEGIQLAMDIQTNTRVGAELGINRHTSDQHRDA